MSVCPCVRMSVCPYIRVCVRFTTCCAGWRAPRPLRCGGRASATSPRDTPNGQRIRCHNRRVNIISCHHVVVVVGVNMRVYIVFCFVLARYYSYYTNEFMFCDPFFSALCALVVPALFVFVSRQYSYLKVFHFGWLYVACGQLALLFTFGVDDTLSCRSCVNHGIQIRIKRLRLEHDSFSLAHPT